MIFKIGDRIQLLNAFGTVKAVHGSRGELLTIAWDGAGASQVDLDFHAVSFAPSCLRGENSEAAA